VLPEVEKRAVWRRRGDTARALGRHLTPTLRRRNRLEIADGLRDAFQELGGTYVKMGQLIASSPTLFGDDVSARFRDCLDAGPPVPFDDLRAVIEDELQRPITEAFAQLEPTPLAAASVAVVHKGRLHDGREVAVKILRPGIDDLVAADIAVMRPLFAFIGNQIAVGVAGVLPGLVDGLEEQLVEELDLRREAETLSWAARQVEDMKLTRLRIPTFVPELSARRALTMELLPGSPIDDLDAVDDVAELREALVDAWRFFFTTALVQGRFHGDVHAGNLLALPDNTIGVLDWGIVGRLDPETHHFFRRAIEGVLGDESAWKDVAAHVVNVYGEGMQRALGLTSDEQIVAFIRSQVEPILTRPLGEVDLRMLVNNQPVATRADRGGVRTKLRIWREERAIQRAFNESGALGSDFDRGMFMLGKQLVYLERYGKLYLPDMPLVWDQELFRQLLARPLSSSA
jgi:aarF domain-containing kinase